MLPTHHLSEGLSKKYLGNLALRPTAQEQEVSHSNSFSNFALVRMSISGNLIHHTLTTEEVYQCQCYCHKFNLFCFCPYNFHTSLHIGLAYLCVRVSVLLIIIWQAKEDEARSPFGENPGVGSGLSDNLHLCQGNLRVYRITYLNNIYDLYGHLLLTSVTIHFCQVFAFTCTPCCCLVGRPQRLHRPLFPFSSFSTLSSFPHGYGTCYMQHIASTAPFIPDTVPGQLGRSDAASVSGVTVM